MEGFLIYVDMIYRTIATFCVVILHFIVPLASSKWGDPKCLSRDPNSIYNLTRSNAKNTITCAKPVDLLKDGQLSSGISTKHANILPPWFNSTLFANGQKFADKYFFGNFLGPFYAINIFLSFPDIKSVLVFTSKSDTKNKSQRRYLATLLHMKLWYENLPKGSEEINPAILESFHNVRVIHNKIAKITKDKTPYQIKSKSSYKIDQRFWSAVKKDLEQSDIPLKNRNYPEDLEFGKDSKALNNLAMSLTQWLLGAPSILYPERTGIHGATDEELWAWNHLWAIIGYVLGMEDEYNVFLQPDLKTAKAYYKEVYDKYYIPTFFQMDEDSKILWETFFTSFMEVIFGPNGSRLVKKEHFMIFAFEHFIQIKAPHIRATLSRSDAVINSVLERVISMLRIPTVRNTINSLIKRYYFEAGGMKVFNNNMKTVDDILNLAYA